MRLHFYKDMFFLFLFFAVVFLMISCGKSTDNNDPWKKKGVKEGETAGQIKYEVCKVEELPDELYELIEDKKEKPFQFTYENSVHLYIAVGYGRQQGKKYVASVRNFYEKEEVIVADMILLGVSKAEGRDAGEPDLCPYIVLKCEKTGKPVIFLE